MKNIPKEYETGDSAIDRLIDELAGRAASARTRDLLREIVTTAVKLGEETYICERDGRHCPVPGRDNPLIPNEERDRGGRMAQPSAPYNEVQLLRLWPSLRDDTRHQRGQAVRARAEEKK